MKFQTTLRKDIKEINFFLQSRYKITAFYKRSYSKTYENAYRKKLIHIEFYGETVSETGFRSWFGNLEKFEDIEKGVRAVAEYLEQKTIKEYPNLLLKIQQPKLF